MYLMIGSCPDPRFVIGELSQHAECLLRVGSRESVVDGLVREVDFAFA